MTTWIKRQNAHGTTSIPCRRARLNRFQGSTARRRPGIIAAAKPPGHRQITYAGRPDSVAAASAVGLDWRDHVDHGPALARPSEIL
jgi:hypothetical protein